MAPPTITSLPPELIELILVFAALASDYSVITAIPSLCRELRALVYNSGDNHLWRQIFLTTFDDPRASGSREMYIARAFDWGYHYKRQIHAQRYIARVVAAQMPSGSRSQENAVYEKRIAITANDENLAHALVSAVITSMPSRRWSMRPVLDDTSGAPQASDKYPIFLRTLDVVPSKNILWLCGTLANGYPPGFTALLASEQHEMWSEHSDVLRVVACTGFLPPAAEAQADCLRERVRRNARAHVYDTNYPTSARHWGPFLRAHPATHSESKGLSHTPPVDALRVDWAWLAAARVVVEANLREASAGALRLSLPGLMQLDGTRACTAPDITDWAGAAGVWRRCVCWMDFRDLVLNNAFPPSQRFTDSTLLESVRVIPMTIRVISTGEPSTRWPDRPPLHLEGHVAGAHHQRRIHGTVYMTPDDNIRWSMTSKNDDGDSEWVMEGVQIGCVASAMGVLGMWTGALHEQTDPIGPCWQWKVG